MQKFHFRIQTRSGLVVENLTIQAVDQTEAEKRMRQIYMHSTVLEVRVLHDNPMKGEASDLEDVISLIAGSSDSPEK